MYKLIALDMDGTLLNSDKVISEENKQAIAKARETGVTVVLASGRPLEGMQDKLDELNINSDKDFVLYYNGSMVKTLAPMKSSTSRSLMAKLRRKLHAKHASLALMFTHSAKSMV